MPTLLDYRPPADLLQHKIILVTGAGDGLGRAAAKAFAQHGATVILLGRTVSKLEKVYDEIEQAGWPQAAIYPMNLEGASSQDYDELANRLTEAFGHLDGLLHNAAFLGALTPIAQYDVALWQRVMQINLNAPFLLTRACLPLLRQAAQASVLFTSCAVAQQPKAYWGAYAVSKAGQDTLMGILAEELEANTHIRVNSFDPGPVRTFLRSRAYPGEDPARLPAPDALMPAYLYLMGADGQARQGQRLHPHSPIASAD